MNMAKKALFIMGILVCIASISTIFWGRFDGFSSAERILVPLLAVVAASPAYFQYIFDRRMVFGLISVPVEGGAFRILIACVAFYFMVLPLLLA